MDWELWNHFFVISHYCGLKSNPDESVLIVFMSRKRHFLHMSLKLLLYFLSCSLLTHRTFNNNSVPHSRSTANRYRKLSKHLHSLFLYATSTPDDLEHVTKDYIIDCSMYNIVPLCNYYAKKKENFCMTNILDSAWNKFSILLS